MSSSSTTLSLYHLDEGNTFLINNQFQKAIEKYTSCIDTNGDEVVDSQNNYITFRAYSHRSQAYLHIKEYNKAKLDIEKCHSLLQLKGDDDNNDGTNTFDKSEIALTYLRLGRAQLELKEYEACMESFQRAKSHLESAEGKNEEYNLNLIDAHLKDCQRAIMSSSKSSTTVEKSPTPASAPVVKSESTAHASSKTKKAITCPKYQYYQNDSFMTISILEPNLTPSKIKVQFSIDKLTVIIQKGGKNFTVICGTLFSSTIIAKSKVKYTDEKILIKLKKKYKHDWNTLFGGGATSDEKEADGYDEVIVIGELDNEVGNTTSTTSSSSSSTTAATMTRPYASTKDWNAIDRELKRAEESETPGPDGAFNKFLQDIYKGADEDTRRAMIKSYQTSGGTHLSCNWNEVEKTDYEKQRTAPKGQEWKNWEGQKLPMKDDDN